MARLGYFQHLNYKTQTKQRSHVWNVVTIATMVLSANAKPVD
jgi:hypothetical protein